MGQIREVNALEALRKYVSGFNTQKDAAVDLGVSAPFLGDVLKGRRHVSERLLKKLGLRETVVEAR